MADIIFEDRMSDADALMWNIEKDPSLRSTIVTVMTFDRALPRDVIERRMDRLSRVIPRLRQRVRSNPLSVAPPRWEVDPYFDLDYHLRFAKVPGDGTLDDVLNYAAPIAMQGFDRARPLWECTLLDGFDGDKSAIVMKLHHSMTDGVGGMKLQLELFDLQPGAEERAMPPEPEAHVLTQPERVANAFEHEMRRGVDTVRNLGVQGLASVFGLIADPQGAVTQASELANSIGRLTRPTTTPLSPLMAHRSLSVYLATLEMPLSLAKAAAKKVGGKLNDAFVAAVCLGIVDYHQKLGATTEALRMGIPINVRSQTAGNVAGNAFIPARIDIPIDFDDPFELMRHVHELVIEARDEPANELLELLSNGINRLPTSVTTAFFGTMLKGTDFTTSNVPGAPIPIYVGDALMTAQYAFGPTSGAGMNITLVSYQDECNIGVNLDPAAVSEPDLMIDCLRAGIDQVLALGR